MGFEGVSPHITNAPTKRTKITRILRKIFCHRFIDTSILEFILNAVKGQFWQWQTFDKQKK